jgi:hypothetical protein
MAIPWKRRIKNSGKLTVYNNMSVGQWANIFTLAIQSFNDLSTRHGLKVKLVETNEKERADIVMSLLDDEAFKGLVHGKARLSSQNGFLVGVEVRLPSQPAQNHKDVLLFIALHELVHACGLEDKDHDIDGVFMTLPNIRDGKIWASQDSRKMPPYFLAPSTVSKINALWS